MYKFIIHPNEQDFFNDLIVFLYDRNKNFYDESIDDRELMEGLEYLSANIIDYLKGKKVLIEKNKKKRWVLKWKMKNSMSLK